MNPNAKQDRLISRHQMVEIASEYNLFVSMGTMHRWANEPDFPLPRGKNGKSLLYLRQEYEAFLKNRIKRIQMEH